jgi:hypothetical protein
VIAVRNAGSAPLEFRSTKKPRSPGFFLAAALAAVIDSGVDVPPAQFVHALK